MVLITAPTSIDIIEYLGLPSASICLLIAVLAIKNGKPIAVIRVYIWAKGSTSSVAPNPLSIGVKRFLLPQRDKPENQDECQGIA